MNEAVLNRSEALYLKAIFNYLHEPLEKMYARQVETFQKSDPTYKFFKKGSLNQFQRNFTSSVGMEGLLHKTDGSIPQLTKPGQGYSQNYGYKELGRKWDITKMAILDAAGGVKSPSEAATRVAPVVAEINSKFHTAIMRSKVQYAMGAVGAGLEEREVIDYKLKLTSADTIDATFGGVKNTLFSNTHKTVSKDGTGTDSITQSNKFYAETGIGGDDPAQQPKLADFLFKVKQTMGLYKNDDNQYVGVNPTRIMVASQNFTLIKHLKNMLSSEMFGKYGDNPVAGAFEIYDTPYLGDVLGFTHGDASGAAQPFLVIDEGWNAQNNGPELTERLPLRFWSVLDEKTGILENFCETAFDFNACDWRGVAICCAGTPTGTNGSAFDPANWTAITLDSTLVKPVTVTNAADFA